MLDEPLPGHQDPTKPSMPDDGNAASLPARAGRVKVMYVISDLSVGGAEMMLYKLLAGTDNSRFEPVVVSLLEGGALRLRVESLGVRVYTLGVWPRLPTPLVLWRLVRLTQKIKPDLV